METQTLAASPAVAVVERFVRLMAQGDLRGVVDLYDPAATWEVHVPGWDAVLAERNDMLDLHAPFFGREAFRVDRHGVTADGDRAALSWDLGWRDRDSGCPAASFQNHHFAVRHGRIARHRMYCAGVRVVTPEDAGEEDVP